MASGVDSRKRKLADLSPALQSDIEQRRPRSRSVSFGADVKSIDGPRPESVVLNDLVLAFFESGSINGPGDLLSATERWQRDGQVQVDLCQVAERLRRVLRQLETRDSFIGLLPSNVRLSGEHRIHLAQLEAWMARCCGFDDTSTE